MKSLNNYINEQIENEKFSQITMESYTDLSDEEKLRFFDFCQPLITENEDDEIEIVTEKVDLEEFLESNGAIKKEDAFKAFNSKADDKD